MALTSAGTSDGAAPTRCMPVSTFTWTDVRWPMVRAAWENCSMASCEYTVGVMP